MQENKKSPKTKEIKTKD